VTDGTIGHDSQRDRVLDELPMFVVYLDAELRIAVCNRAAARAMGSTPEDVVGARLTDVTREGSPMTAAVLEVVTALAPRSFTFHTAVLAPDAPPRTYSGSLVPDLDEEGSLRGVFATAIDVTDEVAGLRMSARLGDSLNVILQAIARLRDPMALLDRLADEALGAVGGDYTLVSIRSGRSWVVSHHHGTGGEDRVGIQYALEDRPVLFDAASTGQIQYVEDAMNHSRTNKDIMERFGIKSFVAVPLTLRGETLGVFEIAYTKARNKFDGPTRAYLTNLASAASLAYGRMREYQHEHRIADTLQAAILRLPTDVRGLRFASHYAAASEEALVGGDFFDLFEIDAGTAGVTIGDVSGKGLSAAIITSRIRDCLRLCALDGLTPSQCVTKTNYLIHRITPSDVFATLVFGIINSVSGEFTYVCAAHPPGILQRADGTIAMLESSGSVVGGFSAVEFAQRSITLEPGDALLLYTDGLTEARREGEMYGVERLTAYLCERRRSSLEVLVNDVFNRVRAYTGDKLRDDVATLALTLDRPTGHAPAVEADAC
jgi:GAF domain-containing protein